MLINEAIKILENEISCVNKECNIERNCGNCEYAMPSKEPIIEAYSMAIQSLKSFNDALQNIKKEICLLTSRYSISKERGGMGQVEWSDRLITENDIFQVFDKYIKEVGNDV